MCAGYDSIKSPETIDKDAWRRSSHILNIVTYGEMLTIRGEEFQNPYYIVQGCIIMLQVAAPLFKETIYIKKTHNEIEKEIKETRYGIKTSKYANYVKKISEAKHLINCSLQNTLDNRQQCLEEAYAIITQVKMSLLQDVSDLGLNFKSKPNPNDLYLEQKK